MITKAKVNLASVKKFDLSATKVKEYSSKFIRGIACLEELLSCLAELGTDLKDNISDMQTAHEKLAVKIRSIEEIIAKLTAQIHELQDRLSDLEDELSGMCESITMTNKDGEEYEIPNPAYEALAARISALEGEIDLVERELYPHQQRLEQANSVDSQLSSHIDAINGVIYSLEEKRKTCKQLRTELEDVKNSNSRKSTNAVDNLKKIEQIIAGYLRIKMVYDSATPSDESGKSRGNGGININININKTTVVNEPTAAQGVEGKQVEFQKEDIEKHHIKLDADKHICEYESRKYGGKYNSYEVRINGTPANNPILVEYEGARGESKYIPSNRSAEGIVVIVILSEYGLNGIEYRNGEPDFEVCSEAIVAVKAMTENRDDYYDLNGERQLGNFSQADIELAKIWKFEEKDGRKDWKARGVLNYRKVNGFTWHEKCDTETMVLVRLEINAYFKHIGGCSECRLRDADGNEGGGFNE